MDPIENLGSLQPHQLTNGYVTELFSQIKGKVEWKDICDGLEKVFGHRNDERQIRSSFVYLKNKRRELLKNKSKSCEAETCFNNFISAPYQLPQSACASPKCPSKDTVKQKSSTDLQLEKLQNEYKRLVESKSSLIDENEILQNKVDSLQQSIQSLKPLSDIKRLNQTLKRKNKSIELWKKKYFQKCKESDVIKYNKLQKRFDEKCDQLKKMKKTCRRMKSYHKNKSVKNAPVQSANNLPDIKQIFEKQKQCNDNVRWLEDQLEQTKAMLNESNSALNTKYDGKRYSNAVREASYYLQALGVAEAKTSAAIAAVYQSLTGNEISTNDLPSASTQRLLATEMKAVNRQQIKEALVNEKDTTLKFDGTTKGGQHLTEVELSSKNNSYLLGIRQQVGSKANDYVDTIMDVVNDICDASTLSTEQGNINILHNISNTMSDRCVTNDSIEKKLSETIKPLNTFKCAMHPLDTIARECEKVIRTHDATLPISNGLQPFTKGGESNTQALVRCVGKLFHDPACGCGAELTKYLKMNNFSTSDNDDLQKKTLFPRFVGNRFHVYFLDAGLVYLYCDHLVSFLSKVHGSTNNLQTSVFNALSSDKLKPQLRVLGLVGKYITGPWMRIFKTDQSILDMNQVFQDAKVNIENLIDNPASILSGTAASVFNSAPVIKDNVFLKLTQAGPCETASYLIVHLLRAVLGVMNRQLSSQLPGGKFWDPSSELKSEAKSCSATNISGERMFAMVDAQLQKATNQSTAKVEAKVMFRANKTTDWLQQQDQHSRHHRITLAMKDARRLRAQEMEKRNDLDEKLCEKIRLSRKAISDKENKSRVHFEDYVETVLKHDGLWKTEEDIDNHLSSLNKTKSLEALKAQINVRIKVLGCQASRKMALSKASINDLKLYLLELFVVEVDELHLPLDSVLCNPVSLAGKSFMQVWEDDSTTALSEKQYRGQVIRIVCDDSVSEYEIKYDGDNKLYYMTIDEVITDMVMGDIQLLD